jgi:hypothetical protein
LVRQRSSVEHEAALHGDALLVVAEPLGRRAAADGDEQQLGLDHVAALDGHRDAVVGRLDALERRAGRKAILRLRKARSSALEDASSSAATSRGRASTMVTSAPKLTPDAGELARR